MIICRSPFRISFFGGGTDYPVWYRKNSGSVLSATINKYSYINARFLPPFFDYKFRVRYFRQEATSSIDEITHPSVRECLRFLGVDQGVEVLHTADLPARSGLGSSSTFTVGMLHSLYSLKNRMPTKRELALQAIHIEQSIIQEAVGSQDQVAAAFGGLNLISFGGTNEFDVQPVLISDRRLRELQGNLLLCFTGFARTASEIAAEQIKITPMKADELNKMSQLCRDAFEVLVDDGISLDVFGELINEQWCVKRNLTSLITSADIDEIYEQGLKNGAIGGKLLGAGGGGFMLFYAPAQFHDQIKKALSQYMFVPFRFEFTGSKIIYFSREWD
jgi:D-glycero-alpha-D-manno-heptose-7-phosphate kinase